MSFLISFGKLLQATANASILPLCVVKDVFTLGGVIIEKPSSTISRLKDIEENIIDSYDELGKD